ncbi:LacI family DNA-binding transcriptional regulator [Gulosibacter chungangensis]|uniref:LacI family transcriptional regulator n=1 Tax=Gulosibacter chungangensis TaxID=979746 RepID=A0A7J5B9S2_9MICO|nr:LacI family DNA-binding transcriptional regulator [Gulosibacter chungangensis]KAB1642320.1 LacI family transcriptional regulator [Gulosibacter chungangensis]
MSTGTSKRPTMRDVAEVAGVSHALVSLAYRKPEKVSPERRERIFQAAETLGFRRNWVASSLSAYASSFTGILVANLHNPVFSTIVEAARAELDSVGRYSLMSSAVMPNRDGSYRADLRIVQSFEDLNAAGYLVVGVIPDISILREVRPDVPIVVAAASIEEFPRALSVRTDNEIGMQQLISHFVEQGHSKIAHLGGAGGPAARRRAAAYEKAMRDAGLESEARVIPAEFTEESGRDAFAQLLTEAPDTTAVSCVNDLVALGAMSAARTAGLRVPEDIAIAGYDNTFLAGIEAIGLTTVDTEAAEIGRIAASWLAADEPPPAGTEHLVPPKLVVRRSTLNTSR